MALSNDPPSSSHTVATIALNRGRLHKHFDQHLTDDGTSTGTTNAIGDYSVTSDIFYFSAEDTVRIARLIVTIEDNANLAADNYGGLSALTNGLHIHHYDADFVVLETFNDTLIKTNVDWAKHAVNMNEHAFGSGNNFVVVEWNFQEAGTMLRIEQGEHLGVDLNDDFSGLVAHEFVVQGLHEELYD